MIEVLVNDVQLVHIRDNMFVGHTRVEELFCQLFDGLFDQGKWSLCRFVHASVRLPLEAERVLEAFDCRHHVAGEVEKKLSLRGKLVPILNAKLGLLDAFDGRDSLWQANCSCPAYVGR